MDVGGGEMLRRRRASTRLWCFLVCSLVLGLLPMLPIVPADPAGAVILTRPIPGPLVVTITDDGFEPAVASIVAGQTLIVENGTAVDQTYTASDDWIDSGVIAPGGRFVMAAAAGTLGTHPVVSTPTPAFTGAISIGLLDLPNNGSDYVSSTTLTQWASPTNAPDIHPEWGVAASRNRALVTFGSSATISQSSTAFAAAGVNVIGAMKAYGLVAVEVPDSGVAGDFAALDAAIATLRTRPGVSSVSYDFGMSGEATLPRPANPDPGDAVDPPPAADFSWTWLDERTAAGAPAGSGGNWGLEASRAPSAWNLIDGVTSLTDPSLPDVVVLDIGFVAGHPDAPLTYEIICDSLGANCTAPVADSHGSAVTSIVGAPFDRDSAVAGASAGLQSIAPRVNVHGVDIPQSTFAVDTVPTNATFMIDYIGILDRILAARSAEFPRLRALNMSLGGVLFNGTGEAVWAKLFAGKQCGPGLGDDATPTEPCTPNNHDSFAVEISAAGEAHRGVVGAYAQNNVLIVHAAGNESDLEDAACLPYLSPICDPIKLRADAVVPLIRLERNWGSGTPPIIAVEAYNTVLAADAEGLPIAQRDSYSNIGGDVSAPGDQVLVAGSGTSPATYSAFDGTSSAAPHVTSLVAYLIALRMPSFLTYADARRAIIGTARNDVTDGGAPRIDAYAAAMTIAGSTVRMVDVNDPSADGNRRVVYDENGTFVAADTTVAIAGKRGTAADGRVDIRDLRRYRDAHYRYCQSNDVGAPTCPATDQILLDGDPLTNPHFDLNLDGCIALCPNDDFSRFDFNADGMLDSSASAVPISATTGAPLATPATTSMTDLDVLRSVWGTGSGAQTQGWTQAQVGSLLHSADVQVETADLFAQGATKVEVRGFSGAGADPTPLTTLTSQPAQPLVLTVPVDVADPGPGGAIRVLTTITWPDGTSVDWVSSTMQVLLGEDVVVRPCSNQLTLDADRDTIRAGDVDVAITATLEGCFGLGDLQVAGHPVTFEIVGDAAAGVLTDAEPTTDVAGQARVMFSASDDFEGSITLKATVDVGGIDLVAVTPLGIADPPTIWYAWRQTNLEYRRGATNDKGGVGDDCEADWAAHPANTCFTTHQELDFDDVYVDNVYGVERYGSIDAGLTETDAPIVTERGRFFSNLDTDTGNDIYLTVDGERHRDTGSLDIFNAARITMPNDVLAVGGKLWSAPYVNEPVDGLVFDADPGGVTLGNLRSIGDVLAYPTGVALTQTTGSESLAPLDSPIARPAGAMPNELLLMPRADGSSFQFADDLSEQIRFDKNEDGTYGTYRWCGIVTRDFAAVPPGYWADSDPLVYGLRDPDARQPTRTAGTRYAPTYDGEWRARFELVAVATDGPEPTAEQLAFPTCDATQPEPTIVTEPLVVSEGAETTFRLSVPAEVADPTYDWSFGDGVVSELAEPTHEYDDDGTYPADVTRLAPGAPGQVVARDIVVENVAPEIANLEDTLGELEPSLRMDLLDPGPIDAQALLVTVTSPTPGFVAPAARFFPAGLTDVPLGSQLPGTYTVKVVVADKDGGTDVDTALVWVPTAEEAGGAGGGGAAERGSGAVVGPTSPSGGSGAALDPKPIAAYTINPTTGVTGSGFVVANRSRAGGAAIAATLTAGDGRVAVPIAAGATTTVTYLEPGTFDLAITAGSAPAATASSSVEVTGGSLAPTLTYGPGGATSGAQGALVVVRATLTVPGGDGVGGRLVDFVLGSSVAQAVTGTDGVATTSILVPATPGAITLGVDVPAAGPSPARSLDVPFTVLANNAPTADTGGPYEVGLTGDLILDASASVDPDAGETATLAFAWDLDGDGSYVDDATLGTGAQPAPISWANVQAIVCHGTCDLGESYPIGLRVTDSAGAVTTATTQVSVLVEFGLSISPGGATLVPGSSVSFTVEVFSSSGFTSPVALSTVGLPTGVTKSFSPTSVAPGGTSTLTLTASSSLEETDFELVVSGTADGVTRQAGGAIDVEFGLVPTCTGSVTGRVVDARTGSPIVGATGSGILTDADGEFSMTDLGLAPGNAPKGYNITLNKSGYWPKATSIVAVCGTVPHYDFSMQPVDTITVSGTVRTEAEPQVPIAGASVADGGGNNPVLTGADGTYTRSLTLPAGQSELQTATRGSKLLYHPSYSDLFLARTGEDVTGADIELELICYSKVQVRAINLDTGRPVVGARITFPTGTVVAGADGRATSPDQYLNSGPSARTFTVSARSADGEPNVSASATVTLPACGMVVPVDIVLDYPAADVLATLDVLVVDDDTGAPLTNATVAARWTSLTSDLGFPKTAVDGHSIKTVVLGAGTPTTRTMQYLYASLSGYHWKSTTPSAPVLNQNQTTTATIRMQQVRYGAIEGTVRDAVTGLPIAGVRPSASGKQSIAVTGADGRYRIEGIALDVDGGAVSRSISVPGLPDQYWSLSTGSFMVGETLVTKDLEMIPICASATVRGRIVDATTREPIPTASATISGVVTDAVDADGRFVLTPVPVAFQNKPRSVTITASAPGYQSQSKTVTVFCGANIVVDFGTDEDGTGTIVGTVTDDATDLPVAGAFVGTEFGGSDTTGADGTYEITAAPAGPDDGPRDWEVTVVPPEGSGLGEASKTATVTRDVTTTLDFALGEYVEPPPDNVAPVAVIVATPSATVAEGSSIDVSAATSFDPDSSPGGLSYAWDLDDDGQFDDAVTPSVAVQRADEATVDVAVRVTDQGTIPGPLSDAEAIVLTFTNAPPVVDATGAVSTTVSLQVDVGATFTDLGTADVHTATIDWDDGAGPQAVAVTQATGTVASTSHLYATVDSHDIEVCVTDDDGAVGCDAVTVTPSGIVPGPPIDVSAIGGDGDARLRWKAPLSDGGSPLLLYEIETTPGGATVTVPATELTNLMEPLVNGSDYTFRVRASNVWGWGPWSEPSNVTRPRASCTGSPFSDVDEEHPFCPEITWMGVKGVSNGYANGTYKPTAPITRQAMAAFSYRLLVPGAPALPGCTTAPFTDVPADHAFCPEITWMKTEGISTGYVDGTYKPDAPVARQAMAAFLYRLDGATLGDEPVCLSDEFTDVPVAHPFCGEIRWLVGSGVAEGYADGSYGTTAGVARQAMAAFIFRYNILAALIP